MRRITLLFLILGLLAGCSTGEVGEQLSGGAPDFTLPAVDGSIVRLSDYQGKVIVVDFWATWCPPCLEMIPVLSDLHHRFSSKGLVILGVSLDKEGLPVLGPFIHERRIPYKVLLGSREVSAVFGGISTIPTMFIIDRSGRLVRKMVGYHSVRELEGQLLQYLEQPDDV
jgi:peroxiredoxin